MRAWERCSATPGWRRTTTFILETPGTDEGFDAVNLRRAWQLYAGAATLPLLPPRAFRVDRRASRQVADG